MCFLSTKLECGPRLRVLQLLLWYVEAGRSLANLRLMFRA